MKATKLPGGSRRLSHAAEARSWQMLYSGLKVPLLLLATQAGVTILLAAMAPFTLFWYASFSDYDNAILFNAGIFAIASITGQVLLRRFYRPLILKNRRHVILLRLWLVIYAFVGIQMGWLLRPFIGDPGMPTHFFRSGAWGNAYLEILEKIMRIFVQ